MRIIQRYIGKSVGGSFLITILVLTGILCLGNLLKIADLIFKGMNPLLVLQFFGFLIVGLLEYAIPMAILTATILVFGRLSADNEIVGMRASGIGLLPITAPVFFFGFILMLFCLYLQNTVIPNYSFAVRKLKAQIALQDPDILLQPGEDITFPGYTINFEKKQDGILYGIHIYQYDGDVLASDIFAKRAAIEFDRNREGFTMKLFDGTVEEITDQENPQIRTTTTFGEFSYPISLKELYAREKVTDQDKRKKDMTRGELINNRRVLLGRISDRERELSELHEEVDRLSEGQNNRLKEVSGYITKMHQRLFLSSCLSGEPNYQIILKKLNDGQSEFGKREIALFRKETPENRLELLGKIMERDRRLVEVRKDIARRGDKLNDQLGEVSNYTTELHKRLSLAAACLSLVFISIPLAIKAHRSEKTIGMALSLALIFFYYIFIAYADAVADNYRIYPYLIVWVPNILFIVFGTFWMIKFTRI